LITNPLKPSEIPTAESNEKAVLGWASDAISEGEAFLRSQSGYDDIPKIIEGIMGESGQDLMRPSAMSSLTFNQMGKIGLDLASSLTDIKPFWEYHTANTRFQGQADMGQKLASAWWGRRNIDLKFCDVIKYAIAAGTGIPHLVWNPDTQDQDIIPEDPRDVLPIRPSDMISMQNCFGVAIRRERTVNYLRERHPEMRNSIVADREGSYAALAKNTRYQRLVETLGLKSGFMQNVFSSMGGPAAKNLNVPVADVFTIYVKDDRVNQTGKDQIMGDPTTNWSYLVKPGEPLYPRKRCIELTRSAKLYDGPNIYWHGMFPCPKLTLDPWPWSWLGKSPMRDVLPLQRELNRTVRGISDLFEKLWRPDIVADKNSISKALLDRVDSRKAGLKIRTNPVAGQGMRYEYPPIEKVAIAMEWVKMLTDGGKDLSGTQELSSLVQLGQIPSSETIERMIESMSPAIRLRSRVMEAFMQELAMMVLMNFFQFYTTGKRIVILGPKGQTFEDYDFDPGTLIPDMLSMGFMDDLGNPLPRYQRAKVFIENFVYQIAPGSLLAASEVTDKLMYLQLTRMGIMDPATLLEKLAVPNVGLPPDFPDGIVQRLQWFAQQQIGLAPGPASGGGAGGGPGRPASGQSMPRMVVKES